MVQDYHQLINNFSIRSLTSVRGGSNITVDNTTPTSPIINLVNAPTVSGTITTTGGNIVASLGNISTTVGNISSAGSLSAGTGLTVAGGEVITSGTLRSSRIYFKPIALI